MAATDTTKRLRNPLENAAPERLAELDRLSALTRDERLRERLDELAVVVGRLRRRLENGREVWTDLDVWALEQIAAGVETIDVMLGPSAGHLVAIMAPGCDEAVDAAIEQVDQRRTKLRRALGSLDPFERRFD